HRMAGHDRLSRSARATATAFRDRRSRAEAVAVAAWPGPLSRSLGTLARSPGTHSRVTIGQAGSSCEEAAMMYWYGNGMSGWGYVLMTAVMVLFWGLVIVGGIALVRFLTSGSWRWPERLAPEDVLAERFARGEIDEAEYRERLQVLETALYPRS